MQNRYDDPETYDRALRRAYHWMRALIGLVRSQSADQPTFFLNFLHPQQNGLGRLISRYDARSPTFFIQRLNRMLHDHMADFKGGHVLDIEQVASVLGRHLVQDDAFWVFSHAGTVNDYDFEQDVGRLEPEAPLSERYPRDVTGFVRAAWGEAVAMLRTLQGTDRVKMICVDLDDTLWRGVLADAEDFDHHATEGAPLGFAEALMICRQRGIILAIVSKNDEARAAEILEHAFQGRVRLEDFAIRKINWDPKPQNVAAAIREANVLPESVVHIDDNPVERAAVKALLPKVRMLGAPHLDWRRILLWSPETQVAEITSESASRSDMVRAQVEREQDREGMTHADFLAELDLQIELGAIASIADQQFRRALELINKTNQFNTTGERWSEGQAETFLAAGGRWWVFRVRDRYTAYGLVGVVVQKASRIEQFAMSCRVFGLQVERAVLAALRELEPEIAEARLIETPKNGPCREVYAQAGWTRDGEAWIAGPIQPPPAHVTIKSFEVTNA
ncbi:MAG: HAD-IIIC family phosphatase [Asticcacaulis sp.]|nr:HAD-IIIC family phosphatase [Asticcacaulis sp.]